MKLQVDSSVVDEFAACRVLRYTLFSVRYQKLSRVAWAVREELPRLW
jgi:hypothetical protein